MKKILGKVTYFFHLLLQVVLSYPKSVVSGFLALFLVCILSFRDLKLELDIYDVYDQDFQSSIDHFDIKEIYKDRSQMLVSFNFKKDPTAGEVCKILIWSKKLNQYSEVKSIASLWSIRAPKIEGDRLWYPRVLDDPCEKSSDEVVGLQKRFETSFFSHMLSRKSKDLVFDISFSGFESDTKQVHYVIDMTDAFIKSELPGVTVSYLGLGSSRFYFKKIMLQDSAYNLLIVLVIILLLRVLYGTWKSGVILVITLLGANILLYGFMALFGISVDILTNNLFLMIAVSATADFIFVTQAQFKQSYESCWRSYIFPCFMTTFTTIFGFLSLNTSDITMIGKFGNAAALGAFFEWMMMFVFLPALLKISKQEKIWINPSKSFKFDAFKKLENFKLPKPILLLLILLMLGAVPSFYFLNTQDSPITNLPKDHVMRQSYEKFEKEFGWGGQVYLYFPSITASEQIKIILAKIKTHPLVYKLEDPQDLIKEWTQNTTSLKRELIVRELSMTPLWERYHSNVGALRVPLYLKEQDLNSLKNFRDHIDKICEEKCRLAGQRIVYLEYGEKIVTTMMESFGVSVLIVSIILGFILWGLGKIKEFFPLIISALIGPLVMLSLMAIFQIPVTLVTSIFLAVMVGLAGDNAIQFILADPNDLNEGINNLSRASIVVTLLMMSASLIFLFHSLMPMKILGFLFVAGFFINLAGDLWGLKAMLEKKS